LEWTKLDISNFICSLVVMNPSACMITFHTVRVYSGLHDILKVLIVIISETTQDRDIVIIKN